jgi:hypothetical protein
MSRISGTNGAVVPDVDRDPLIDRVVRGPDGVQVADEEVAFRHRHGAFLDLRLDLLGDRGRCK